MSAVNFNLRGIDPKVMAVLKSEAEKTHTSVNLLILMCIEKTLGYTFKINKPIYSDLDYLSGTWTKEEAKAFKENTLYFETIDKDLWS
jgi:hypothetical protein